MPRASAGRSKPGWPAIALGVKANIADTALFHYRVLGLQRHSRSPAYKRVKEQLRMNSQIVSDLPSFLVFGLTNENGIVAQELRTPAWHNGDLFFRHQIILMLMLHVDQGSRCTTFADLPRPPLQRHVLAAWGWHGARCAARCAARSAVVQAHQPSQLKSCFSSYLLLTSLLKDAFLGSGFRSIESRLTQTRNLKSDRRP